MSSPVVERKLVTLKSGRTYNLRVGHKPISLPVAKEEAPVVAPPMVAKKAEGGGGSRPVKEEEELVHLIKRCDKDPHVHSDAIPEVSSHVFHSKSRPTEAFQHTVDTIKHHSGTYQMFDIMCKPTGLPKGTKINMSGHTYDYDGRPKDTTGELFVEISVHGPGGGYEEGVQNVEMLVAFADKTRDYGKIGSLGNYRYNLSIPIQDIINVLTKLVKAEGGGGSRPVKVEEKKEDKSIELIKRIQKDFAELSKSEQNDLEKSLPGYGSSYDDGLLRKDISEYIERNYTNFRRRDYSSEKAFIIGGIRARIAEYIRMNRHRINENSKYIRVPRSLQDEVLKMLVGKEHTAIHEYYPKEYRYSMNEPVKA